MALAGVFSSIPLLIYFGPGSAAAVLLAFVAGTCVGRRARPRPTATAALADDGGSELGIERDLELERYDMLSQIAGLVVHDLSSPLMAVEYCSMEILNDPSRASDPDVRELLQTSSGRYLELVSALRSYLKGGSDGQVGSSVGDAWKAADRLIRMRHLLDERQDTDRIVEITVSGAGTEARASIDQGDMIHLMVNVVGNAVSALRSEKTTASGHVVVDVDSDGDKSLAISISDDGPGLSAERFESLTSRAPGRNKSSSMGLKLVRAMIESRGGSIRVETPPRMGHGTSLLILLPLAPPSVISRSI